MALAFSRNDSNNLVAPEQRIIMAFGGHGIFISPGNHKNEDMLGFSEKEKLNPLVHYE